MATSTGGPPNTNQAVSEAPSTKTTIGLLLQARWSSLVIPNASMARLLDRLVLDSYVKLMEWGRPLVETSAPGSDATWAIIDRWNLFNKRDSSITHMHDLYPNNL